MAYTIPCCPRYSRGGLWPIPYPAAQGTGEGGGGGAYGLYHTLLPKVQERGLIPCPAAYILCMALRVLLTSVFFIAVVVQ